MTWQKITYEMGYGKIILPNAAPFDGKPVLIKTASGIVEAWWDKGGSYNTSEGVENTGWEWVCYDDAFHEDLDSALYWMPVPQVIEEIILTYNPFINNVCESENNG